MHVLGGYHEIVRLAWSEAEGTLSGQYRRAPGLAGKALLYLPEGYRPRGDVKAEGGSFVLKEHGSSVWVQEIEFKEAVVNWSMAIERLR